MADLFLNILKQYWGFDNFRGVQRQIIESVAAGRDTLGLMPTGGGKSVAFQVPALAADGLCIVVTPLIALMKDQVNHLRQRGIKAAAIYSGMPPREIVETLENCIFGNYKFLYVSPERLASELFIAKLKHIPVSLITVDEAHCISQWGYDFRPAYLQIARLRDLIPSAPVLALTATATPQVADDIQQQLRFAKKNVISMSFARPNLAYIVRNTEDKVAELIHILNHTHGSAIVYTRNREKTKEIAKILNENHISASFFHAGIDDAQKDIRQKQWTSDKIRVIVATNAFGMGIDKPDVRLVAHIDIPDCIESYFQEAGRAGRDGKRAYAVLLYHPSDHSRLTRRISDEFPNKNAVKEIYEHLCCYFQLALDDGLNLTRQFDIDDFCRCFHHFPTQTLSALRLIQQAGYISYSEESGNASRVHFLARRDELYRLNNLTNEEDHVVSAILRAYGGMFSEYIYIDERALAARTNLSPDTVYHSLISLNKKGILHYIPRKHLPQITFLRRRVEKDELSLPQQIYEDRRTDFELRIKSILFYASQSHTCRSRLLLHYFGEEDSADCGICDVCLERKRKPKPASDETVGKLCALIKERLADGRGHSVMEMQFPGFSRDLTAQTVERMVQEEIVRIDSGQLFLDEG